MASENPYEAPSTEEHVPIAWRHIGKVALRAWLMIATGVAFLMMGWAIMMCLIAPSIHVELCCIALICGSLGGCAVVLRHAIWNGFELIPT